MHSIWHQSMIYAEKTQEDLWKEQGKILLSLNDKDLEKMLELKENHDEPWKVIDNIIREFLLSPLIVLFGQSIIKQMK